MYLLVMACLSGLLYLLLAALLDWPRPGKWRRG